MKLNELFGNKTVMFFEVFPPKSEDGTDTVYETFEGLENLNPDFISVACEAGGDANCSKTLEIESAVKNKYGVESAAHLPCINLTRENAF